MPSKYEIGVALLSTLGGFIAAKFTKENRERGESLVSQRWGLPSWAGEVAATLVSAGAAWLIARVGAGMRVREVAERASRILKHDEVRIAEYFQGIRDEYYVVAFMAAAIGALIAYNQQKRVPWGAVAKAPILWVGLLIAALTYFANKGVTGTIGFLIGNVQLLFLLAIFFVIYKVAKWGGDTFHDLKQAGEGASTIFGTEKKKKKKKAEEKKGEMEAAIEKYDRKKTEADVAVGAVGTLKRRVAGLKEAIKENKVGPDQIEAAQGDLDDANAAVASQAARVRALEDTDPPDEAKIEAAQAKLTSLRVTTRTSKAKLSTLKEKSEALKKAKEDLLLAEEDLERAERSARELQAAADELKRKADRATEAYEKAEREAHEDKAAH